MPQLDSLGLKENPFNNNTAQRYFYADQNRAQILESTEHLIEFSNNLQVVMGETGVGKSHFLAALQARKDNNWRVAKVKDASEHDTLSLIQAILHSFGVMPNDDAELLETLENQLSEIIQLGFKPVLLIDNAQALSVDSLRFLLQLSRQQQHDEPYIHIVLFATTVITDILQTPELKDFRDIIHIAVINNFDKEGVAGYLRHKLTVAGFNRESPFTPRIIDSIYKDSAGIAAQINFFASKFLASSGKGENYIETEPPVVSSVHTNNEVKFTPDDIKTASFNGPGYSDLSVEKDRQSYNSLAADDNENINAYNAMDIDDVHSNDQIDEQLNRLTEKFDEIEKMSEQIDENSYSDEDLTDNEYREFDAPEEDLMDQPFYETKDSNLPKFIIPVVLGGFVLLALFIINSVFNQSEDMADETNQNENIELLPLELPSEGSFAAKSKSDKSPQLEKSLQPVKSLQPDKKLNEDNVEAVKYDLDAAEPEIVSELEIIEAGSSETKLQAIEQQTGSNSSTAVIPEIIAIDPEPIIGSNKPQYVTIRGHNFTEDMSLTVFFGSQKKEFSKTLTPKEWNYENKGKIKLYVITGIENQQWQMVAKNSNEKQSKSIHFDVVKPFIPQMGISAILPNPLVGSNKRQKVTITGKGFSKQTEVKLEWDKNKKHFSSRLTPDQFEYVDNNKINLFITTGTKERLWKVFVINSGSGQQNSTSFKVISEAAAEKPALKAKVKAKTVQEKNIAGSRTAKTALAKGKAWIWTQNPSHYTIQLLALSNEQAVKSFIDAQNIKQKSVYFKINRNGKPLYVLIYGVYTDQKSADQAKDKLQSRIKGSKPWVRNFSDIHGLIKQ